jgi:hypothetical protein
MDRQVMLPIDQAREVRMFRLVLTLSLGTVFLAPVVEAPAYAQIKTVTAQPTVKSMESGEVVLFDDKKCPKGQIMRYTKSQRKEQINKKCIHVTGLGK